MNTSDTCQGLIADLTQINLQKEANAVNRKMLFKNGQLKYDDKKSLLGKRAGRSGDPDADEEGIDQQAINPSNYRNVRMGEAFVDPKHFFELHY